MKKIFAIIILATALVACSREEQPEVVDQPGAPKTYTMTVSANKDAGTRALSLVGQTLSATWAEGEAVTVYNETKKAALTGTLTAQSAGASTTLKGTLTGTIENGDQLKLKFLNPSYSSQEGTLEYIASHCDYAEATVTVSNASTPSVTTSDATFTNQQAIVKFTLKDKADGTTPVSVSSLTVNADGSTYTVTPSYVKDVLFVAIPAISSKTVTLTATDGISSYTYEKASATFANGKYYEIGVQMTNTTDYLTVPLTFEAKTAGATVTFTPAESLSLPLEYSINGGAWEEYSSAVTLSRVGDKVSFRGNNAAYAVKVSSFTVYHSSFSCSQNCFIYGNVMSLIDKENYSTNKTLTETYTFYFLFYGNSKLYSHASKAIMLPATTLTDTCYGNMFGSCTNITSAPALPATTMASYCYSGMFYNCSGITTPPVLPATTLASGCYRQMFTSTNLNTAPELPVTTLAPYCYEYMFWNCKKLTTAPELPATTLASDCYRYMFKGCTSLSTAPILPATNLAYECYYQMFRGCSKLSTVTCLATNISASNCTTDWLDGVAATGTFNKAAPMTGWTENSTSGIPTGWTIVNHTGSGTSKDPYLIYSLEDWDSFAAKVNGGSEPYAHARQMANISGVSTIIGTSSHPFKGTYDGQGYTISNVDITGSSSNVGLFGYVNDASAVIENVVVASGKITGLNQNVGSIVGQLNKGTIRYCANSADVSSTYTSSYARCGGIVGWMCSSGGSSNLVTYCINFGNVSSYNYSAGIAGSFGSGAVTHNQNYGKISINDSSKRVCGGIIGYYNSGTLTNNHNGGDVIRENSSEASQFIQGSSGTVDSSNTYWTSMKLVVNGTEYTGSALASYANGATAVNSNPAGITIGGVTYAGPGV